MFGDPIFISFVWVQKAFREIYDIVIGMVEIRKPMEILRIIYITKSTGDDCLEFLESFLTGWSSTKLSAYRAVASPAATENATIDLSKPLLFILRMHA